LARSKVRRRACVKNRAEALAVHLGLEKPVGYEVTLGLLGRTGIPVWRRSWRKRHRGEDS
jgi:hypothetical protein